MTDVPSEPAVLLSTRGAVALVTLNRPQALNSFTRQMHQQLWTALDAVEADEPQRAALTGPGQELSPTNEQLLLEDARTLCRENPMAVANIVKNWVNGEVAA